MNASGGLVVDSSRALVLARCVGERPFIDAPLATFEIRAGSRVHAYESQFTGQPGMEAISLSSSFLECFGSSATGGDGLNAVPPFLACQNGGDGLVLDGASSRAVLLDSVLAGGAGGLPNCASGQGLVVLAGSATTLTGIHHAYQVSSPAREGETVTGTIRGNPGNLAWIHYSSAPGPGLSSPLFDGELLLAAPVQSFFAGVIPASGVLAVSASAPALAPGAESATFFSQAVLRDAATGRFRVGSPSTLVILDGSF